MFKKLYFKSWLLLLCLIVGASSAWADKITDYNNIVSGKKYYIGATTSSTDYYLYVLGTYASTNIAGTAKENKEDASIFTFEGSGTQWTIKFESGKYLSLPSTKQNGKVNVVTDPSTFTVSNQNGKIRLTIGSFSIQKNNSGTQFGSYGNTQTDVWLEEVNASPLASIALSGEYPTSFYQGDAFSHEGMTVTATYEDESTKDVTAAATFSGYDMSTTGEQEVTVSYTEGEVTKTATYGITVNAPATLESISLSGTYQIVFTEGDEFNHDGVVVTANYDDETTKDVSADAEFSTPDMSTPGVKTVTVTYNEKTATYDITVNELPKYTVTFSDGGAVTQASYGAEVTLPSRSDISEYAFAGWSETNVEIETTTAPIIIPAGSYTPTANITLYPVYTKTEGGGGTTNKTASVTISDYASTNNWSSGSQYSSISLDDNIKVQAVGSSNTGKYYTTGNGSWRIYKSENGYMKISASNGELTSATITFSNSTLLFNSKNMTSGTAVSLSGSSASFYAGGTTYITAISVDYTISGGGTTYYWSAPVAAAVERPEITVAENPFLFSTTATITCDTEDAVIKYSFDGENWNDYSEALTITATTTIYAKATKGDDESTVASVTVTKNLAEPNVTVSGDLTVDLNGETNIEAGTLTASVTYEEEAVEGATVTWSTSNPDIAEINETTGAVTIKARGSVTFTATYAGNSDYSEAIGTKTIVVTDSKAPGTEGKPYTVAEAIAAIDADEGVTDVYVSGIVCTGGSNLSSGALTYWISDDGTETNKFQVYKGKGIDGASFTSTSDVQVGDVVVVKGNITLYGSSTYEFDAGSQLVSLTRKEVPTLAFGQTSYTVRMGQELTITATSTESDGAITYESSDTEVAEIDAETGVVTTKAIGTTTITATIAETATYKSTTAQVTLTVVDARDFVTEITAISPTTVFVGQTGTFTLTETQAGEATYSYSSSDASVLEISENMFVGKKNGEVEVTVTATPTDEVTYQPVIFVATVNVDYKYDAPAIENAEFSNSTSVTIPAIEGADVYYTLDGTTPTASSTKYTAAIELDVTTTIKAIAIDNEGCVSPVATATYTKVAAKKDAIDLTDGKTLIFDDFSTLGGYENNRTDYIIADDGDTYQWTGSQYCRNNNELQMRAKGNSNGTGTITSSTISSVRGFVLTIVRAGGSGIPVVYVGDVEQTNTSATSGIYVYNIENTSTAINIQSGNSYALYIKSITIAPIREATTLAFDEPVTEVMVGANITNAATASREGTITYRSSDETVATVDSESGEVTGVKIGTATITAFIAANTDYNEASASYEITVNGIPAATITGINISEVTVGDVDVLTATYTKAQDMESDVTLTMASSDEGVLSVADVEGEYMYEAVKGGTATVTVTITPADVDHYTTVSKEFEVTVLNEQKGTTELAIWDAENEVESGSTVYGANVTLTALLATNYDGVVTATQTNDKIADVTITGENITITPKAVGTTTITFTAPETANFEGSVAKTFALTVTAPEAKTVCEVVDAVVILNETFNGCDGTGGNDGVYSGNVAGKTIQYDGNSWTVTNTSGADKCIKVGTSSGGSATTPTMTLEADKTYTISFRVAGWSGDGTTLTLTASKGTLSQTSITMNSGAWTEHSVTLTGANGETTIKFQPTKRCFLDEVKVEIPAIAPVIPDVTIAESGYGSFCCEYPLDFSESNEDYKAWYVSKVEGATVTFTQITGTIAGGVPFFLYGTPGTYSLKVVAESTETLTDNLLRGTLAPTYVETVEGDYTNFALSKGAFAKMNTGTVKANKAFLPVLTENLPSDGGARLMIVFAEDGIVTDVVKNIRRDGDSNMHYYNLKGQRVENPTKGGLYIVNGQKVVVK